MPSSTGRHGGMSGLAATAVAFLTLASPLSAQIVRPFAPGMVVTESTRIAPESHLVIGPSSLDSALIVIRGNDITVDMTGFTLLGRNDTANPDDGRGIAVLIDGGSNITVRGATIRGYRFGLVARGVRNLRLINNDLSYNWKPRLFSLIEHESLVDWMSFHNNEKNEWMRFGAAFFLEDVTGGELRGNRAVQGMNGLLLVRSDSMRIEDNEFAYNSALGIGMYRASHNTIVRNRMDYNVRGYSHGFYNRGQDSAGILLYEQSSHNVIAYNSLTHGGDGLFLWAGQSTMDTGEGGANDNLIFGNDLSWAPTNSVEVTFSRNRVIANRLIGSRYGVWGGYSFESEFVGNCFGLNETGIAIEHGQDNRIARNRFDGDKTAVQLWSRASEPADWGYSQNRDTRSRDNHVTDNVFAGNDEVWKLNRTVNLVVNANRTTPQAADPQACDPRTLLGDDYARLAPDLGDSSGSTPTVPPVARASLDRSAMIVDEWGPYDGRSPKLWPVDPNREVVRLQVLGPEGEWRMVAQTGVSELSTQSGHTGDTLTVVPEIVGAWSIELEYSGAETTSSMGKRTDAGQPVRFSFERFEPAIQWGVAFYSGTPDVESGQAEAGEAETRADEEPESVPLFRRAESRLDYMWYSPTMDGLPQENWGLEATGTVTLPAGEYTIRTISDDAIRVWVDGELMLDHWEPHESSVDYAEITAGTHDLRVLYRQVGGWSELRFEIVKGPPPPP
jgi:parallel beta-helix repeat protein